MIHESGYRGKTQVCGTGQGPVRKRGQDTREKGARILFADSGFLFLGINMHLLKTWLILVLLTSFYFSCSSGYAEISVVDDAGCPISLDHPAKRIISLYGGMTEIVCAIGACNQLVGVTKRDSWPVQVKNKPKIGTHMRPNLELILALRPELVLQGSSRPGSQMVVQKLKEMGIKVAIFNPRNFPTLYSTIERVAKLCGHEEEGRSLIEHMQGQLESAKKRYPLKKRPSIIFEVSYPSLLFAGQKNIVNDIIRKAGAENIVKKDKKFVRFSLEQIIVDDPDVYVVQKGPMNRTNVSPQKRPNFDAIRAVRAGQVLVVDEFLFSRPGPRSVKAVEQLRGYLYSLYGRDRTNERQMGGR